MKKTTNRRLIAVLILFGIFLLITFSRIIYTMLDDREKLSKEPLAEHYNLFTEEGQNKLQLLATTTSRNREPTSHYIYDKRFDVFVLKTVLANNNSLKNVISYKNKPSHISMNAVYSSLSDFNMEMYIKSGKSVVASIIHLKFNGDRIITIQKNDNLYCYYFIFRTFSINYNKEPYDIVAKAKKTTIPASVVFKKKDNFIYIILMTVAEGREEMQPDQLYRIINK